MTVTTTVNFERGWQYKINGQVKAFMEDLAEKIERDAKVLCPTDNGRLQSSIDHEVDGHSVGTYVVRIGTNVDYALYVEMGTKPHVIRPRGLGTYVNISSSGATVTGGSGKKALYWPGARHPVKEVHHPGTRAQPFLRPALYKNKG